MVIVKIGEKEYNLPESWSEVSLEKFEKIMQKNALIKEYKSQIQFGLEIFAILIDVEVDDLKNITRKSFEALTKETEWIQSEVKGHEKEEFVIDGEVYRPFKDLNKLKMGDTVSLELMISESNETTLLGNILPILLRKVKKIKCEDGSTKEELEDFDPTTYNERKNIFKKNLFITDVVNFQHFF